jgi:TRAP-type C4-dicarboxylate transport system substrate-binding protein
MKTAFRFILGILVAACILSLSQTNFSWAGEKSFELSFTGPYADKHPTVINAFVPWMKELKKDSGNKLEVRYFNPGTLCPEREVPESTEAGSVDIGSSVCGLSPGKFPLNELMELPFLVTSAEAGSLIVWDLYQRYPAWQKEFAKVKLLWQWTSATFQLHTTKKLVKTLEDLKGMKILGFTPRILDIIKALGASPVQIKPMESYLALERGMADGILLPLAPLKSFKITDAAKYHTIMDALVVPFWAGLNLDVWKDLPKDLKKLLKDTTGGKMAKICGATLDQGAKNDAKWMKAQGHVFYVLPLEEKKKWVGATQSIHQKWLKKMEKKGYKDIRPMYDAAMQLAEKYNKTTGKGYE